jgi:hypothetical protein
LVRYNEEDVGCSHRHLVLVACAVASLNGLGLQPQPKASRGAKLLEVLGYWSRSALGVLHSLSACEAHELDLRRGWKHV